MKTIICCLNSKYVHASLSPWCLAAGVKTFGTLCADTEVLEGTVNADVNEIAEKIIGKRPFAVAFSCYIWNITKTLELCRKVKEKLGCYTVLGGPEVAFRADDVLKRYKFVDFLLSGEGEQSFPKLLDTLISGGDLNEVSGLSYRQGEVLISVPETCPDDTPPSPYTDEFFKSLNGRICYIETSRGCPYRCAFCLSGRCSKLRFFDIRQVKTDIIRLSVSGTKTVKFVDRTFNANELRANDILLFIKDNYGGKIPNGVCFHFEIAGDILSESTLEILSSMPKGAVQLEIGMQSFNEDTLKAVNRTTNTEKLIKNIKRLIGFGNMHIHIDLIAGLKGEDMKSFERSFNIGYSLKAHMLQMGFLKLLYGAEMRENREKYPCEFKEEPPYEVTSTPWLSSVEIKQLKNCEDALERLYNSGRFLNTLDYLLDCCNYTPFGLLLAFGNAVSGEGKSLKAYARELFEFFKPLCDERVLRDAIVSDLLLSGSIEHVPENLKIMSPIYKKVKKALLNPKSRFVLLSKEKSVLVVDDTEHKDFFGRAKGRICSFSELGIDIK